MMGLSELINIRINNYRVERGLNWTQLSDLCGIPKSTFSSLINKPNQCASVALLCRLTYGLGITLKTFFDDPMFNELIGENKDENR